MKDIWILTQRIEDDRGYDICEEFIECFVGKPSEAQVIQAILVSEGVAVWRTDLVKIFANRESNIIAKWGLTRYDCEKHQAKEGKAPDTAITP